MLSDELARVALVIGADGLLVLPLLRHKGPPHFQGLPQKQSQLHTQGICNTNTSMSSVVVVVVMKQRPPVSDL